MENTRSFDVLQAMTLARRTQKSYGPWIIRFAHEVGGLEGASLRALDLDALAAVFTVGAIKTWLGQEKADHPNRGIGSLQNARNAVSWLGHLLAELELVDVALPDALREMPTPRAEAGQRPGHWLSQTEIEKLLEVAQSTLIWRPRLRSRNVAMICLMALAGLRCGEIQAARWSDLERRTDYTVQIVHGKNSKRRIVKLPPVVVDWLDQWQHSPDAAHNDLIFINIYTHAGAYQGMSHDVIRNTVIKVAARAGLGHVAPHDLRRSFSRIAYQSGASFESIKQDLGHASVAMTERYVNSQLELGLTATDILVNWLEADDHA